MRQLKVLLIIGNENESKIKVLEEINRKYNVNVTKKVTTDKSLDKYPEFYEYISLDKFSEYLGNEDTPTIRTFSYTDHGFSGYINLDVGQSVCDNLGKKVESVVLNIDYNELPHYIENYKNVSTIFCADKKRKGTVQLEDTFDAVIYYDSLDLSIIDGFLTNKESVDVKAIIKK